MSTPNTKPDRISEKKPDVITEKKDGRDATKTSQSTQLPNNSRGPKVQVSKQNLATEDGGKFESTGSMQPMLDHQGAEGEVKGPGGSTEGLNSPKDIDSKEGEKNKGKGPGKKKEVLNNAQQIVKGEEGKVKGSGGRNGQKEIDSQESDKDKGKGPGSSKEVLNSAQEIVKDSKEDEQEKVVGPASSKVPSGGQIANDVDAHNTGSLSKDPNSTGDIQAKKDGSKRRSPPEQNLQPARKEDLRTGLLSGTNPEDESGSKCGCLKCLKPDKEPCLCTDFLKCGEQWENKPAKKYVRLFSLLLPAIAMIILQVVNSTQDNDLTKTWCLSPRDKDGFGPLFVNIFFFWGWGDAICMTLVYVIIAVSVMIRGNRVFLFSSLWIILASGLLYWGIALGSDCQAGVSTLNLGLAFFNLTQGGLEFLWNMKVNYYALLASLVTLITYLALLFKKVIPDAHTSFWAHLYSSVAGVVVSIAYAWWRYRKIQKQPDSGDLMA